ncbi:MAG: DUF1178 family protein [Paracoccaceae bacterium]
MIRYNLKCDQDHSFDSWFKSAEAFETLQAVGHISCAICGSTSITKALMAPPVAKKGSAKVDLTTPEGDVAENLSKMRKHVEENSTYVGGKFAEVARDMHEGVAPEKSIWGEAKPEEAKALIEEGIPVAPLPFLPKRQAN